MAMQQEEMVQAVKIIKESSDDGVVSKDTIEAEISIDLPDTDIGGKEENNNVSLQSGTQHQHRVILNADLTGDGDGSSEVGVGELDNVENSEEMQLKKEVKSDSDPGKCCIQLMAEVAKLKEVNKKQKEDLEKAEKLCKLKDGGIKLQEERIKLLEQELELEKPKKKKEVYDVDE